MDLEFYSFLPHAIGIEPFTGRDAYGDRSYGSIIYYRGRIQNRRRKVINRDGDEVISETTLYLATTNGISPDDRITLPSGYYPAHPEIISIKRETDEWGAYSTTIYA